MPALTTVDLPALLRSLECALFDCLQCCLDAKLLQQTDNFGSDRLVDPQTPERDAAISSVVQEAALAMILADVT